MNEEELKEKVKKIVSDLIPEIKNQILKELTNDFEKIYKTI